MDRAAQIYGIPSRDFIQPKTKASFASIPISLSKPPSSSQTKTKITIRTFSSHRRGILDILSLPDAPTTTRAQVATALVQWKAEEFESVAVSRGMCVSAYRTFGEWDRHPHAKTLIDKPPISVVKNNDAPKRMITKNTNPLGDIRVLDLSRVLAGPVAGRALAGELLSCWFHLIDLSSF